MTNKSFSRMGLFACALTVAIYSAVPTTAYAIPYTLTPQDRQEIETLLQSFFNAARDGNTEAIQSTFPTEAEFQQIFAAGTQPIIERHRHAIDRDVGVLRTTFANGTWVGITGPFLRASTINITTCGRVGSATSECTDGPMIQWRVGTQTQRMVIDRLVRINGHWRIFDARL